MCNNSDDTADAFDDIPDTTSDLFDPDKADDTVDPDWDVPPEHLIEISKSERE